jgi:hypothetical protein
MIFMIIIGFVLLYIWLPSQDTIRIIKAIEKNKEKQ